MMKHLFRPSILIALSAAVVVGAVVVVFQGPPAQGRPTPLPVAAGDVEIVWLYTATNATSWERFVTAVKRTAKRLQRLHPGLQAEDNAAFPQQTTAVPQVSLSWSGPGPRFVFRWYKLTSDWKTRDWIEALLKRQPPPLAIIGGSSSDNARELALHLQQVAADLPETDRPLLLLTQATADRVAASPDSRGEADQGSGTASPTRKGVRLTRLYPGRTFRFCFTNKQMATAVTDFIWWQQDLRPDSDPVYMTQWDDDSYSRDLVGAFWDALRLLMAKSMVNYWGWLSGSAASGLWPPLNPFGSGIFPVDRLPLNSLNPSDVGSGFYLAIPPTPQVIDSSVGGYATPNRYEAKVARDLLDLLLNQDRPQKRPLLILTGQAQPSRRFLRASSVRLLMSPGALSSPVAIPSPSTRSTATGKSPGTSKNCPSHWCSSVIATPSIRTPAFVREPIVRIESVKTNPTTRPRRAPRTCCCMRTSWKRCCKLGRRRTDRPLPMRANWRNVSPMPACSRSESFWTARASPCLAKMVNG